MNERALYVVPQPGNDGSGPFQPLLFLSKADAVQAAREVSRGNGCEVDVLVFHAQQVLSVFVSQADLKPK
jgi:hypothetical protein